MSGDDRAHARIEEALAKLGAELSPPAGWQARVMAEVAEVAEVAERPRRRWWRFAVPALAAAVAIAVVLWAIRPPAPMLEQVFVPAAAPTQLAFAILEKGDRVTRAGTAAAGEVITAAVDDVFAATATGSAPHRAVWIYREQRRLVVACPGDARCSSTSDAVTATVKLELSGSYTLVALTSRAPIPAPTDSYDASMAAAERAGAEPKPTQLLVP